MTDEIKPNETNSYDAGTTSEGGSKDANQTQSSETNSNQSSDSGTEGGQKTEDSLNLEKLNELAGRKDENAFKSLDDFTKHYSNLASFVGKKTEVKTEVKDDKSGDDDISKLLSSLASDVEQEKFLRRNESIKEGSIEFNLLKKFADGDSKNLQEAYDDEKFQALLKDLTAGREQRESETSLESNQRTGTDSGVSEDTISKAKKGDMNSQLELVKEVLGGKKSS